MERRWIGPRPGASASWSCWPRSSPTPPPDVLAGRQVIHWINNESAVYSLAKGYSGAADSARVVILYHACVAQLGVTPWLEYVHTDDNIADLPSRGEWGVLQTLGGSGSFRVAVIPPLSSFVGPLAPLFGAKSKD
jgi:hypothetical protein